MSATNFDVLLRDQGNRNYELLDVGPGLEYTFLFFNQNDLAEKGPAAMPRANRRWFRQLAFRQAVSLGDRSRSHRSLVYRGRATPLWGHVPPGNKLWVNRSLPRPAPFDRARAAAAAAAGFSWKADGTLVDHEGQPVEFTIVTNSGNAERIQIATIIQDDLKQLGMRVSVVTLELRAMLDRLLTTHDYEACVLGLGGGDGDPNSEMNVWLSSGAPTSGTRGRASRPRPGKPKSTR